MFFSNFHVRVSLLRIIALSKKRFGSSLIFPPLTAAFASWTFLHCIHCALIACSVRINSRRIGWIWNPGVPVLTWHFRTGSWLCHLIYIRSESSSVGRFFVRVYSFYFFCFIYVPKVTGSRHYFGLLSFAFQVVLSTLKSFLSVLVLEMTVVHLKEHQH